MICTIIIMAAAGYEAYIAVVVAVLAVLETYYHTGNARAAIQVGIVTFVSAQISNGIGEWGGSASYASNPSRFFAKAVMHGINGGMTSVALGGDFRSGAVGSFAATLGEPVMFGAVERSDISGPAKATRTMLAAMVGGTVSALSGGKFANGAITASMKWLFNTEETNTKEINQGQEALAGLRKIKDFSNLEAAAKARHGEVTYTFDRNIGGSKALNGSIKIDLADVGSIRPADINSLDMSKFVDMSLTDDAYWAQVDAFEKMTMTLSLERLIVHETMHSVYSDFRLGLPDHHIIIPKTKDFMRKHFNEQIPRYRGDP